MTGQQTQTLRKYVRSPPAGFGRLAWYAPAILWSVSAIGSGSVLFTPRIAARYEYALLWIALVTCLLMWSLIRESARYTIITGRTMLDGFGRLPGPKGWALWVIFLPQLAAAAVGVAGLSALVGSAFAAGFGGNNEPYTLSFLAISTALVVFGGYDGVRRISVYLAFLLVALSIVAAAQVARGFDPILEGLQPSLPSDFDLAFVLPWIGTILAGSMGIIWYSYWTATHGFGGPSELSAEHEEEGDAEAEDREGRVTMLRHWQGLSSRAAAAGVAAGAVVILSFTILGAELLAPDGNVPSGENVAGELATLFQGVWGQFGFWAMILLSIVALGGSVLANQDGWGRSFADITLLLLRPDQRPSFLTRLRLQKFFVIVVTGIAPAAIYLAFSDPVEIMSASGVIGAAHTPFIAALILLVNLRDLPEQLRPGILSVSLLALAGLYYLGVSALRLIA